MDLHGCETYFTRCIKHVLLWRVYYILCSMRHTYPHLAFTIFLYSIYVVGVWQELAQDALWRFCWPSGALHWLCWAELRAASTPGTYRHQRQHQRRQATHRAHRPGNPITCLLDIVILYWHLKQADLTFVGSRPNTIFISTIQIYSFCLT